VEAECRPKLIGGIGQWELFPGMFVIGNARLDRYISVPAASLEPVWRAVQYFDGSRSFAEIAGLVLAAGWKFDVAGLYRKMADAGLVAGTEYSSDINRLSVTWFAAPIGRLFPAWRWWTLLSHLLTMAMLLTVVGAGVVWFVAPVIVGDGWSPSWLEFAVAMFAGTVISLFIHEAGHAVAACAEGVTPSRVRLLGFLGVIPYVMISIPGLYTIRPAARLRVWIAGPLASLGLTSFCYLASGWQTLPLIPRIWLEHMTLANLMVAAWNCCPLLPTDGYFIVATLLRQTNWRTRSWRELSGWVRHRRKPRVLLLLYALGSSSALAVLAVHSIRRILMFTSFSWFGYALVLLLILLFAYKRVALKRRRIAAPAGGF
jgi:hypothetical protein